MKSIIGNITASAMALSVISQLNKTINNMELKISKNDRKKCRNCNNTIVKGQGYIEIPYSYFFQRDNTKKEIEMSKITKIMGLFRKKNGDYESGMILTRTKYKRYCSECLYWLFQNHLKGGYDDWLKKKVADKI